MLDLHINKPKSETKIVVAMSGGVDSSTVAAMLVEAGYQVIGVTLQLYDQGAVLEKKNACCAGQDIYDAQMVAEKINIPHYVLDYESLFKESVINDFVDSYMNGETPLPCVRCNQSVKFRDLVKVAKDLNADALVTGHYIRRFNNDRIAELHQGADPKKDQSYFLFATTKEQLEYLHFPLGGYSKDETRKLAEKYGLEVADKPDSQDICFVPNGDYAKLVSKINPDAIKKGKIFHIDGYELGEHNGVINFTIGQRRGLGVTIGSPLYVVKIDAKDNIVYVGPEEALEKTEFVIKEVNWLGEGEGPDEDQEVSVKIRSTQAPIAARIKPLDNKMVKVTLLQTEKAVTPGQACVFYQDTRVLGGGWITREIN